MRCDILIRGGLVIDGSGSPGRVADMAIRGGRIAAIGSALSGDAGKTIEASGLAVAPGFIDVKTHSDFTLPINPKAESKVRQGVTTEIIGHCGFSVAPALAGRVGELRDYLSASAPWLPFRETSFAEYLDGFPRVAVNAGMLVGHNTLRLMAMGMAARAPSAAELEHMAEMLEEGLAAGALGFSTGLFTPPGAWAGRDEILALCRIVERHKARYFTHLRDESNKVLEAVEEAIDIARLCRIHVEIVHLKCSGIDNWGKAKTVLGMLEAARAEGLDIDCDAYPYAAGSNPLKNLLPQWVQEGGVEAMLARLGEKEARERIRAEIAESGLNNWGRLSSWDCVQISISPNLPQHAGSMIGALAAARSADPLDFLCDYLIEDKGATRVLITSIAEEDIRDILRSASALVGSDGNCVAPYGDVGQGLPHPRFYGTFPRVIGHYVGAERVLPLERAIAKMTGASARAMGLEERGLLREGFHADVAIFDPADFVDRATYEKPHQFPSGERTSVIVNGILVVENARHTGALPGRVLRRGRDGAVR
ncbi:MAG TPA: D-aminoacylase [Stellaceae bacterium]|nr:D-aminoacylase [Stellaceae bacterium]